MHQDVHCLFHRPGIRPRSRRTLGVMSRSTTGSLARLMNMATWSRTPLSRKVAFKIFRHIIFYTHGGKNNSKFFIGIVAEYDLHDDLGSQLVMGQARCRRRWAASGPRIRVVRPSMAGDPGADIVSWVYSGHRVQGLSVDIQPLCRQGPVPGRRWDCPMPSKVRPSISMDTADLHGMASEPGVGIAERHVFRALKDLDHRLVSLHRPR